MKADTIRVLHVFSGLRRNGAESRTMDIYRNIDRQKMQFDFMVHTTEKCDFDEEVLSMGAKIFRVPAYRIINHFEYERAWDSFFSNHPEYSIIHIHTSNVAAPILKMACKHEVPTRIVHSRNGHQTGIIKKQYLRLTRSTINSLATHKFAVSREAGEYVFGKAKFDVWPNAINARVFQFDNNMRDKLRKEMNLQDSHVYAHVGRFIEQKNHAFLIEVFSEILKNDNKAELILVGIGDEMDKIKQLVESKHMNHRVHFLGKRDDIPDLLNTFDVFLFPSLFEGLPGVVLEAQANGIPCLISDTITREAAITDLVVYKSLQDSVKEWANSAISLLNTVRSTTLDVFIQSGYDIVGLAQKYQDFYLEVARSNDEKSSNNC